MSQPGRAFLLLNQPSPPHPTPHPAHGSRGVEAGAENVEEKEPGAEKTLSGFNSCLSRVSLGASGVAVSFSCFCCAEPNHTCYNNAAAFTHVSFCRNVQEPPHPPKREPPVFFQSGEE